MAILGNLMSLKDVTLIYCTLRDSRDSIVGVFGKLLSCIADTKAKGVLSCANFYMKLCRGVFVHFLHPRCQDYT